MPENEVENQINPDKVKFLERVNSSNPLIQIFVKGLDGKTLSTYVENGGLILTIKRQVAEKTGIPIMEQRLMFAGKELKDQLTTTDYDLKKENTLHLVLRLNGGMWEYQAVQKFIEARIGHGNVTGLRTKESKLAVNYIRDKKYAKEISSTKSQLNFPDEYSDPDLQDICFKSMVIEGFHGGNCSEMAKWTAVQLIENSRDQWVYICNFVGKFPLLDTIKMNDKKHPLYSNRRKKINDNLDHVMVVTYPEEAELSAMEASKATVVDTWYNHLVCSLEDYMGSMHPYYNYEYSSRQQLSLNTDNLIIKKKFPAKGIPFANNKEVSIEHIARLKTSIDKKHREERHVARRTKYDFDIDPEVHDERSTANLENLLIESKKTNTHVDEVSLFGRTTFATILKSTNDAALTILFEAAGLIAINIYGSFCYALEGVEVAEFDRFCRLNNSDGIKSYLEYQFFDYDRHPAMVNFLDRIFATSTTYQVKILKALSTAQLNYYILSTSVRFKAMMAVVGIKTEFLAALTALQANGWAALWAKCDNAAVKDIITDLVALDRPTGALALRKLPENKFQHFILNCDSIDALAPGGNGDAVMKSIYAQLKAFGVLVDASDNKSKNYKDKIKSYKWGGYDPTLDY